MGLNMITVHFLQKHSRRLPDLPLMPKSPEWQSIKTLFAGPYLRGGFPGTFFRNARSPPENCYNRSNENRMFSFHIACPLRVVIICICSGWAPCRSPAKDGRQM